jgi:flagellar biogenesis protein FliO
MEYVRLLVKTGVSLAFVAGLIMLCGWALKKYLPNVVAASANRRLKIKEQIAIDAKRKAVILDVDGREYLVMTGAAETIIALPDGGKDG